MNKEKAGSRVQKQKKPATPVAQHTPLRGSSQQTVNRRFKYGAMFALGLIFFLSLGWFGLALFTDREPIDLLSEFNKAKSPATVDEPKQKPEPANYDTKDLNSYQILINKSSPLPANYQPADLVLPKVALEARNPHSELRLRAQVATALEDLVAGAKQDKITTLHLSSGFRPYATQKRIYENAGGASQTLSAPPGASEHQSGLAADLRGAKAGCRLQTCFENEPEGKWLAANAHHYGFIIRYPKGKQTITGYSFEPWHIRYVDIELATELFNNSLTLEEYFAS